MNEQKAESLEEGVSRATIEELRALNGKIPRRLRAKYNLGPTKFFHCDSREFGNMDGFVIADVKPIGMPTLLDFVFLEYQGCYDCLVPSGMQYKLTDELKSPEPIFCAREIGLNKELQLTDNDLIILLGKDYNNLGCEVDVCFSNKDSNLVCLAAIEKVFECRRSGGGYQDANAYVLGMASRYKDSHSLPKSPRGNKIVVPVQFYQIPSKIHEQLALERRK